MKDRLPEFGLRQAAAIALALDLLLMHRLAMANAADRSETVTATDADSAKTMADMDIDELVNLKVSPFEVSSHLDSGYHASNSVSGSRFDTPISELPFAIQAFIESFTKDQKPRDIFEVARYSPGGIVNIITKNPQRQFAAKSAHQTYALLDERYRPSQSNRGWPRELMINFSVRF